MVYVLDENDRVCLTIRIDWSKGGYSPIPKATCEMLNRGCGCGCNKSTNSKDDDATLELTCDELKRLLAQSEPKPKPEPEEDGKNVIPCISPEDFTRLLDEYKYYEKFNTQEQNLGLGVVNYAFGTNKNIYYFSTEVREEEVKAKLKERLENFEPFKGKYFFDVTIEKADDITELGYTKFGSDIYHALISCYIGDHSYCFTNDIFYLGLDNSVNITHGDAVPIVTNDDYDNKGLSASLQNRLNGWDIGTTFGVVKYIGNRVVSVDGISEADKQTFYTKLEDHLFNSQFGSINKGKSTVKFTLGEPTVQAGDDYKEQEYTVPINIEVTTGNITSLAKSTVPMETREVAE